MKINEREKEIENSRKRKRENVLFFPNVKLQKRLLLLGEKEEIKRQFFTCFKEKERKKSVKDVILEEIGADERMRKLSYWRVKA